MKPDDQMVDGVDEDGVEAGGRLVEEDDLRLGDERPRDGDALAHAAGDLGGVFVPHLREADLSQGLLRPRQELGRRKPAALPDGEQDVVQHAERVEERPALEHDAEALADPVEGPPAEGSHVLAVDHHAPGVGPDQPEEVPEQHGLAASRASDDDHQLGLRDLEVDPAEDLLGPKALAEALDADQGSGSAGHDSTDPRK
jgi:hypothetical protein